MEFKEHQIIWTTDKIKRFWDFISKIETEQYFSKVFGKKIIKITNKFINLKGEVLDYGCGPGFFIEYLLEKGTRCSGADFSKDSVEIVNKKFINNKNYKESIVIENFPISFISDKRFQCIFLLETIEHLSVEQIKNTFNEINRIIENGGYIVITTQNKENLKKHETICPDCGCIFHRMQHLSSFSEKTLPILLESFGFEKLHCNALNFRNDSPDAFLKSLYEKINDIIGNYYFKKNLIYIGKKREL